MIIHFDDRSYPDRVAVNSMNSSNKITVNTTVKVTLEEILEGETMNRVTVNGKLIYVEIPPGTEEGEVFDRELSKTHRKH